MKFMKTRPAVLSCTSIRHASPPGPPPLFTVPFALTNLTSEAFIGTRGRGDRFVFGFGVACAGRRRLLDLGGGLTAIDQPQSVGKSRVCPCPELSREKSRRKGNRDIFNTAQCAGSIKRLDYFVNLCTYCFDGWVKNIGSAQPIAVTIIAVVEIIHVNVEQNRPLGQGLKPSIDTRSNPVRSWTERAWDSMKTNARPRALRCQNCIGNSHRTKLVF